MNDTADERESQHGRVISARVPQDLAAKVEAAAARELLSVSAWSRRAIFQAVQSDSAREEILT